MQECRSRRAGGSAFEVRSWVVALSMPLGSSLSGSRHAVGRRIQHSRRVASLPLCRGVSVMQECCSRPRGAVVHSKCEVGSWRCRCRWVRRSAARAARMLMRFHHPRRVAHAGAAERRVRHSKRAAFLAVGAKSLTSQVGSRQHGTLRPVRLLSITRDRTGYLAGARGPRVRGAGVHAGVPARVRRSRRGERPSSSCRAGP
jgi:hypothetical protein